MLTASLQALKVKQKLDERFCGLVVQEKYAKRFVDDRPEKRKLMELRSKALKFLTPGGRICLLSASGTSTRKVLAVLEFNHCTKIAIEELGHYEGLHRVTTQELDAFGWTGSCNGKSHVYGWKFSLVKALDTPIELHYTMGEVWSWFPGSCLNLAKLKRSQELEEIPACQRNLKKRKTSQSFTSCSAVDEVDESDAEEQLDESDHADEGAIRCPPNSWMCALLSEREWDHVCRYGAGSYILRPWEANAQDLCVLVEKPLGIAVVGVISIAKGERADLANRSLQAGLAALYSTRQVNSMKSHKSKWKWPVLRVDKFQDEIFGSCLSIPPRSRVRPFPVSIDKLKAIEKQMPYPSTLDLKETANLFVHCLDTTILDRLKNVMASLCKGKATIRVGTTCSGTDICVTVIKQTLSFLQSHFQCEGVTVEHVFSCEKDAKKRSLLLRDHQPRHCFDDTEVFRTGRGYCHVTGKIVEINKDTCAIDILLSGPVCKDLSLLNPRRKEAAAAYQQGGEEGTGVSGHTYETGFRQARPKGILSEL